jgi:hypothetical protein
VPFSYEGNVEKWKLNVRKDSTPHREFQLWVKENYYYNIDNEAATNQEENDMADEKGKFRAGVEKTFNASKRVAFEAGATALTNTANKELVAEVAKLVEDLSPELAAFLRTDLGRPAALYLAATALHGASTTEVLPFSPDFIQKYAERTQFANVFEVSSLVSDSVLSAIKMAVFAHMSDLHDKVESLAQRHGIVKTVFESVEEVEASEVVLENAVEVKS